MEEFGYTHISVGDLIRTEIKKVSQKKHLIVRLCNASVGLKLTVYVDWLYFE